MLGVDKPSLTYRRMVGCGYIYCIFTEYNNGKFKRLFIRGSMAKSAPCGESWLWGIANLLTFAIRRGFEEGQSALNDGIIKQLVFHSCNIRSVATQHSCISAIGDCVKDYITSKKII